MRFAPPLTSVHYERAFVAMATTGAHRPRSPHAVADVCTILKERGYRVRLTSVDRATNSMRMLIDGVSVSVKSDAKHEADSAVWYFVINTDSPSTFARVGAHRVLVGAPRRFKLPRGHTHPLTALADDWMRLWPRERMEWEDYAANVLGVSALVKRRCDLGYLDAAAIADGVELVVVPRAR